MTHRPLGKLPPLQVIGRSQNFDLEEPPDIDDDDDFDIDEVENELNGLPPLPKVYQFQPDHGELCATALGHTFRTLQPGSYICKKTNPETATLFSHCKYSVSYACKYAQLRQLLQNNARLRLVRDYTSRLSAAAQFVSELEHAVECEYQMWSNICHNCIESPPTTTLQQLGAMCEELRLHMSHWNSIKQTLHTDRWLRPLLPTLCTELEGVHKQLNHLRDMSLWWLDKLIHIGFRVLAHTDVSRLTQDMMWGITRGLEIFNTIVSSLKSTKSTHNKAHAGAVYINSLGNTIEGVKSVPFARIINLLAAERSTYAASLTHQFFTTSSEFQRLVNSSRMVPYDWRDISAPVPTTQRADTSDYHTASTVSITVIRVGTLSAPDLSKHMSPVVDFARREQEFAGKFFQIVCNSTNLLKKVPGLSSVSSVRQSVRHRLGAGSQQGTPVIGRAVVRFSDVGTDSDDNASVKSDSKRKSVSWGDASQGSVIQQLTGKYLETLWQFCGTHVYDMCTTPVWGGPECTEGQLGSIQLCTHTTVLILCRMIQQTCITDIFPVTAQVPLNNTAIRLHLLTAWNAWDMSICQALASRMTDKCMSVPLVDEQCSTKTGKLLKDAFQPLHKTITALVDTIKDSKPSVRSTHGNMLVSTLQRAAVTCDASHAWCQTKINQFLSSWALGSFLLVTQSDLKMLIDECGAIVGSSQSICTLQPGASFTQQSTQSTLNITWQILSQYNINMQTLSGWAIKGFKQRCYEQATEFFEDNFPPAKTWKKKSYTELPLEPSEYVSHAMNTLLEPVIMGVSNLRSTSQLAAVSIATTAVAEAWAAYILRQRIRFSVYGAHQLGLDFLSMRTFVTSQLTNESVRQSVASLDTFKYLTAIVDCLKRQPRGARPSGGKNSAVGVGEPNCDLAMSTTNGSSSQQWHADLHSEVDIPNTVTSNGASPEHSTYKMPDMEQWLALRVQGGARGWPKLPSCFNH